MVGIRMDCGDARRQRLGDRLEHDAECAGVGDLLRILLDRRPLVLPAPLRLETADDVHRLRRQSDMRHHRNPAVNEITDRLGHAPAALDLHRAAIGLLHHASAIAKRHRGAFLIGSEWHIDDDQRAPGAAHNRAAVHDHQLERHRHGCLVAVHNHAEAVADEQEIAVAIRDRRGMRVIGGKRDDGLAPALHGRDVRGHHPFDCGVR